MLPRFPRFRLHHPFIIALFSYAWRHRLDAAEGEHVVFVTGWRSCLIDDKWGQRTGTTFCGWFGH